MDLRGTCVDGRAARCGVGVVVKKKVVTVPLSTTGVEHAIHRAGWWFCWSGEAELVAQDG
jgi:hypothetical protein